MMFFMIQFKASLSTEPREGGLDLEGETANFREPEINMQDF